MVNMYRMWRMSFRKQMVKKMERREPLEYWGELLLTEDGKKWIYDEKHHAWIDVTPPKKR